MTQVTGARRFGRLGLPPQLPGREAPGPQKDWGRQAGGQNDIFQRS